MTTLDDVSKIGCWRLVKTAVAPKSPITIPHPFMLELAALPASFGALGGGIGSLTDEDHATKRFALTAGLMGLGLALGRGAGEKFFPKLLKSPGSKRLAAGAGMGAGGLLSDVVLPSMGLEPVLGNFQTGDFNDF